MAYIGKEPIVGNFQKCDAITVVNGQAAYTLQVGSANVSPESVNHMIVSLNGVIQSPTTAYTVSGATLTFASNLASGDVIDFVLLLGNVLDVGVPSNDTVGAAQIKDDLISGTTALASEPADTDEFLVSDAGTLKRIDYSLIKGGGITAASQWRLTADLTGDASEQVFTANLEVVDTDGYGSLGSAMSQSSGVFTFPSTGYWLITLHGYADLNGDSQAEFRILTTTDNSSYGTAAEAGMGDDDANNFHGSSCSFLFDVTSTTNCKVKFACNSINSDGHVFGDTAGNETHMTFTRLGDT